MNDRRSRQFLLYGVLAIGFLRSVVYSIGVLFDWFHLRPATQGRLLIHVIYQVVGLVSLYLALRYQGRKFKDIGLFIKPRLPEIGRAFGLFFGVLFLQVILMTALYVISSPVVPWLRGVILHRSFDRAALFGTSVSLMSVLLVVVNPFYEELLVRAFLITEVEGLYCSTALAVTASVVLQTSYHLYQGLPAALSHVPIFLVFSLYYVCTRRILPVILAHMFLDVSALALYFRHLH